MSYSFKIITLSTSLLLSIAAQATAPEALTKPYSCPPHKNVEQCKTKAQEEFVACMAVVDSEEQDVEDSLGNHAPAHPTQRACEIDREKRMKECEANCK
ncbi:MAG: hypothetical protein BGO77_00840 [Caedibacter sp. 37-49]|nr:MAG: hypothetical protein BGO77_00840 [Caedibacter sp. 37-49]